MWNNLTYHRVCNKSNTIGVTSGAGTVYPSGSPEFTPLFFWGSSCSILNLYFSVCCVVDHCLFIWQLYCVSFDWRFMITPFGIFKLFSRYVNFLEYRIISRNHRDLLRIIFIPRLTTLKTAREESTMSNFHATLCLAPIRHYISTPHA